ncbi:hypothetical protein Tco_0039626 [Tanacetum coccineum]
MLYQGIEKQTAKVQGSDEGAAARHESGHALIRTDVSNLFEGQPRVEAVQVCTTSHNMDYESEASRKMIRKYSINWSSQEEVRRDLHDKKEQMGNDMYAPGKWWTLPLKKARFIGLNQMIGCCQDCMGKKLADVVEKDLLKIVLTMILRNVVWVINNLF